MRIVAIQKIKSYLLAGKLLHIISLIEMVVIMLIIPEIYKLESQTIFQNGIKTFAIVFLLSLPVLSQLDALSRFQNYKQIKDQIYIYGFDIRILKPVLHSRCQRDAAVLSASELGFEKECKKYFRSMDYKWYNLFPDFLFTKPQFLLSKYFWKTTFFTPTYNSKINYNQKTLIQIRPKQNLEADAKIPAY